MGKEANPQRIKLTLKTAKELAKRELGTAKGLTIEDPRVKGRYYMTLGNLVIRIHPEKIGGIEYIAMTTNWASGICKTIQIFDPRTLEKEFAAEEKYWEQYRKDLFQDWVYSHGVEYCCQKVKEALEKQT